MVPQSWITDCFKIYKVSDEVPKIIEETKKKLESGIDRRKKTLAEVKIQRGIFQGDVLSPSLFIIAMMSLNHILVK